MDLLSLLLQLGLVLQMLLEKVVEFLLLLVDLSLALGHQVNQLLGLVLHACDCLDFLGVFALQDLNFDFIFMVFVSLDQKSFQKHCDLVLFV